MAAAAAVEYGGESMMKAMMALPFVPSLLVICADDGVVFSRSILLYLRRRLPESKRGGHSKTFSCSLRLHVITACPGVGVGVGVFIAVEAFVDRVS